MRRRVHPLAPALLTLATALSTATAAEPEPAAPEFFQERVAPILERRCLRCHDQTSAKGGLALDRAETLLKGGVGGPAIVPGNADESYLLEMVSGDPPEMPQKGDPLTPEEVADLRAWVERGARWPEGLVLKDRRLEGQTWWAFAPLVRPAIPRVNRPDGVRTPVDAFVLAKLEAEGLTPNPEADRRTLIRRLTFDLIGLPPSPGEVAAFLADDRPDAYERLVDRLLASPHHGERWGRHWLDVVHYGDTHGYDKDKRRDHAWPYRDYVIASLNSDKPYTRFLREQIAGDAREPGDPEGLIATGFIAAGPWDFVGHVELREGTVDKAKTRLLDRDDMVANVMSTFQSLTVHCARCHDHKFDPIPQSDYYRLQAVFAGVERGDRPYASPEREAKRRPLEARREAVVDRAKDVAQRIAARTTPEVTDLDERLRDLRRQLADRPQGPPPIPSPTNGYHSAIHKTPEADAWVRVDLGESLPIDEIRLIPARPTDFPDTPGFGLPSRFQVALSDAPDFPEASTVVVEDASRPDHLNAEDEPHVARPTGLRARYVRVAAGRLWKRTDDYVFALAELEVFSGGKNVALGRPVASADAIEAGRWSRRALVDGFDSRGQRPAASDAAEALRADLRYQIQRTERSRREKSEAAVPADLRAEREALTAELRDLDERIKKLSSTDLVYAVVPRTPRSIHLLNRGEVERPGEEVGPGAPSCLPGLPGEFHLSDPTDEGARRAALADWLADPANALTWRSAVNRVWHYHFGRGIVETPNDFGRNGSPPTHPELLDWLACEFRDGGGSLKALHRLIVTSAAYRRSAGPNRSAESKDAENRWLWRRNRQRLDAESVRDGILAVSGTLDRRIGGPGFDLFRFKDDHSPIYDHTAPGVADNPSVRRRTVYRFVVRSVPNPFLECLDAADPNLPVPDRSTTVTALQALAMRNDRFILSQSEEFARRLEREGGDPIERAFHLTLSRGPTPAERAALASHAERFGLAETCRVLFNTNEFMFVD
ncbi:MAG: PSD1 and planctomycete cytochrome C domain-containing protein [Isosphaeraceae bacterium]